MRPFSFRLDSIFNYREYLEKRAQRDLSNAKKEYIGSEKEIERLAERRVEIARTCSEEGFKGIDVSLYKIYRSFMQGLEHDLEGAHINLKKAEEKVKVQQAVLRKKSIKKKTLEVLRDLHLKRYLERLEREEQKAIDELVIIRKGTRA